MKYVQPSLFRKPVRSTVSFFGLFGRSYQRTATIGGGTRKATRKFSGDSWFRKTGGRRFK